MYSEEEMEMSALQRFVESDFKQICVEKQGFGASIKVEGQTFGILGACALIIKNMVDDKDNQLPLEDALVYIYHLINGMYKCTSDGEQAVQDDKQFSDNLDEQFMDIFGSLFKNQEGEQ